MKIRKPKLLKSNTKYIIILGTTFSGSSAIYDYLVGRGDLSNPLPDHTEYQLPQSPGGLMSLESAAGQAFHNSISDYSLTEFWELAKKLNNPIRRINYGQGYSNYLPNFLTNIREFISKITAAKMPMDLEWQRMYESNFKRLFRRFKTSINLPNKTSETRMLVSEDKLINAAKLMHDHIFHPFLNKPVLLNQAGSGWNPEESTKYFDNRKVVLVTRNPYDQFAELKQFKNANNVNEFIKWFKLLQKKITKVNKQIIKKVSFEQFVLENKKTTKAICLHLGISYLIKSRYEASSSIKNINKYKNYLTKYEIERIRKNLDN